MAGIDADADAGFIFHAVDDGREVLELKAEVAATASGVFDHRSNAFGLRQRDIDRFGDARRALLLRDLLQMAAGVEVEQRQSQLLAAGHFINESITGFFQRFFHRVAKVNQVAVVRQDLPRAKVILFTGGFEFGDGLVAERRGAPLALVLVKRAKAVASISAARMAALASPPEALTCAPTYFIKTPVKAAGGG